MHYELRNYKHLSMEAARYLLEEESGSRADSIGTNTLSETGGTVGYFQLTNGKAALFTGSGPYLTSTTVTQPGAGTSRSYALWIRPGAWAEMGLFDDGPYAMSIETTESSPTDSVVSYHTRVNGSWWSDATWTHLPINRYSWTHIVATHNGVTSRWALYLNGQEVYEHGWSSRYDDDASCYDLNLGKCNVTGYGLYNGAIDDFRVFNKPLSGQEVNEIYASYHPYEIG